MPTTKRRPGRPAKHPRERISRPLFFSAADHEIAQELAEEYERQVMAATGLAQKIRPAAALISAAKDVLGRED